MTNSNVKTMVAKVLMAGSLAGAFAMAAPVHAEAQQFAVGVQFGGPRVECRHDDYYRVERYDRLRAEEFRRHEAFERREEWRRAHEYRGYNRGGWYGYR